MKKMFIGALVGIVVLIGGVYILTPSASTVTNQNTKNNNKYVTLESKTTTKPTVNLPQGVTLTISAQAQGTGDINYFENAIKDKYMGDGSVQIYVSQITGALGSPVSAIYDVDINGKEELGLTATRTITTQGFSDTISTGPLVFGKTQA